MQITDTEQMNDTLRAFLFNTKIGYVGICWTDKGVCRVQLPEASRQAATEKLLGQQAKPMQGSNLPAFIENAVEKIRDHLNGSPQNLSTIKIDISRCPDFHQRVYKALQMVPSGQTVSYVQLAQAAGSPMPRERSGKPWRVIHCRS